MELYIKEEKREKIGGEWILFVFSVVILLTSAFFFAHTQFPSFFLSIPEIVKKEDVSPYDEIEINFSRPIIPKYFGWKLEVYPQTKFQYHWEKNFTKLVIKPENYWMPDSNYQLMISGRNFLLASFFESVSFRTVTYPGLTEFYPVSEAKGVELDIEDPIHAVFDRPIKDFSIKFSLSPFVDMDYRIDDDSNRIDLMPKGELEKGKKYKIEVFVRHKVESENAYKKIGETSFETKLPPPPQNWDKNYFIRIEQAKKFTPALITKGKYIDINLKNQVLSIFEDGKLLDAYMVSTGKRGMETPQGTFYIANKARRPWSKEYGLFMPFWQALVPSGKFGIHELPEWPGGYKEGANHLGTPVSHGCVRLGVGPAEYVYGWTEIGTAVVIHI